METINNSPLLILRQNNKSFKARQKQLDHRVRNKKHLRQEIYSNHNIFQSNINLYRNMTAQNIIWDRNYNFKCVINQIKEENSSLKARIWNVQKQNRRMERQIEAWNLSEYAHSNSSKKPYIDMATVQKVLMDQDYNIVSMKMQIFELQKLLQSRELDLSRVSQRIKNSPKLNSLLNHQIAKKKVQVCECIGQTGGKKQFEQQSKQKLSLNIMRQNQNLDLIAKNIQIKKKSKITIQNQLEFVSADCELQKQITYAEIERLGEEIKKMRAEEDGGISLQREKIGLVQKSVMEYECFMQKQMDHFIKIKIPLQIQMEKLSKQLNECLPTQRCSIKGIASFYQI